VTSTSSAPTTSSNAWSGSQSHRADGDGRGAHDLTLYVVKWSAQQPARLDFRMAGLEAYFHAADDHQRFRLQLRACILASGQRFPQAYYFEAGRNALAYGTPPLRAWYWDPQAGLLRYELPDGEVFELAPAGERAPGGSAAG